VLTPVPRAVEFPKGELATLLLHISILGNLSYRQLKKLSKSVKVLSFDESEAIVKRGDKGIGIYLILEGSAEVRRGSRALARLSIGQFFGEMAIFDRQLRSADVIAVRPSKVAILSEADFWRFAESEPTVLRGILEEMVRRLRQTNLALSD
jgi:CRP-like cAMP-binding protein